MAAVLAIAPGASAGGVSPPGPVDPDASGRDRDVIVDRDDVVIDTSCRVRVVADTIVDANGDGVVHIVAPDVIVEFETPLRGQAPGSRPDAGSGTGISIRAPGVTLRGARVSGYRVGIEALEADRLVVEDCDVSDNFAQHLGSTPAAEDGADWLWPHENDERQWRERYGAGLWIERSRGVTVRRVRARRTQNGIVISRVDDSRLYDNDCSFLSGWGLAMWRSSGNVIARNAFDFCVRGYSHGVYNRGQDSAGLLMFEQCSGNLVAENSITHGGDGVFAFAGREALGEGNPRPDVDGRPADWYARRGNTGNIFLRNDLSYAVAHGLELTFSFDNRIEQNAFIENGICGIWGGYSQDTIIQRNVFRRNGSAGYGLERGGVNIEHGFGNRIVGNTFAENACGVHLWWDPDEGLMQTPWARRNERGCDQNVIMRNRFDGDRIAIHLRDTGGVTMVEQNSPRDVGTELEIDGDSPVGPVELGFLGEPADDPLPGATRPVGSREDLRGRAHIVMGAWGPYDWEGPFLLPVRTTGAQHHLRLLGTATEPDAVEVQGAEWRRDGDELVITPRADEAITVYAVAVRVGDETLRATGTLSSLEWTIRVFPWTVDPREDADAWRAEAEVNGRTVQRGDLKLLYAMGGPGNVLGVLDVTEHFGTLASTTVTLPAGMWRIRTRSDDGIRVRVDGKLVIDDWTWHGPTEHDADVEIAERGAVRIGVEHFELDGYAVLEVGLERARSDPDADF